jgi:MerR family copper efflux transcriptional regulator
MALRVSELAARTGVSADTIRFYERKSLLAAPERTPGGYRQFDEGAIRRVRFIKGARSLGLKLAEIRELLQIQDNGTCPCGHTRQFVERHINELDNEIGELEALRAELETLKELECPTTEGPHERAWPCEIEFVKRGGE